MAAPASNRGQPVSRAASSLVNTTNLGRPPIRSYESRGSSPPKPRLAARGRVAVQRLVTRWCRHRLSLRSSTPDLSNAGASGQTIRAYRGDLLQFAAHHDGEISELTAAPVRAFLAEIAALAPSTRKRKRASVASFCKWAVRHELLDANPMDRIDTIKVPKTLPRPAAAADVATALGVICSRRPRKDLPLDRLRDRVLFEGLVRLPVPERARLV